MEIEVDVGALRAYLMDHCGTAAFSGFPAAMLDVWDIESASGQELCEMAERLGIDLSRFAHSVKSVKGTEVLTGFDTEQ